MYSPEFPKRAQAPTVPKVTQAGFKTNYESTYQAGISNAPKQMNYQPQSVSTKGLQETHWKAGNEPIPMETDYQREFRKYPVQPQQPVRTRDELMASSIPFDDQTPMETRESLSNSKAVAAQPHQTVTNQQLRQTHFSLKENSADSNDWKTTSQIAFGNPRGEPAKPINMELRSGEGAKAAILNPDGFSLYQSEMKSQFRPMQNTFAEPNPEMEARIRNSHVVLGDEPTNYQTASQAAFKRMPFVAKDPNEAKRQKASLYQSDIIPKAAEDQKFPHSAYQDNFVAHPEFHPPRAVEKTAYASHHDYRNCDQVFTTSAHDAFLPKKVEPSKPADLGLRETHIAFGQPGWTETRSLYQDTFVPRPHCAEMAEFSKCRQSNTQSHLQMTDGEQNLKSVSQSTYVPHPGFKPPPPQKFEQIEHVITPSDSSLTVKESTMKASFIPYKADRVKPANNYLQQSHINISRGTPDSWSTTQGEYFQFKTYKMH